MGLSLLGALGVGLGSSLVNNALNQRSTDEAFSRQKALYDYQMKNWLSPQAQAKNLAAAGLNPAVAFGNDSPVLNGNGSMPSVVPSTLSVGTQSLSELAQYIAASAEAKKKGVEIPNIEEDTKSKVLSNSRQEFENELRSKYGLRQVAAEVALAEENVKLAKDQGDINQIEKAIKQWTEAKEKALKECTENQRDILKKELDNTDTRLDLENLIKKTQAKANEASASASYASAEASRTQAEVNRENRRIQAALADIEESSKTDRLNSLIAKYQSDQSISDADAAEARVRLSRLLSVEDKRSSSFFKELDDYSEWLKSKIKIFGK